MAVSGVAHSQGGRLAAVFYPFEHSSPYASDRYERVEDGLVINDVTEDDAGVYKCKAMVISTGQLKMMHIRVEVLIPPLITGPEPLTKVFEGESMQVSSMIRGTLNG
jgi:hypothetical protein